MRMTPLVFLLTAGILFGLPPASGATALTIPGTGEKAPSGSSTARPGIRT